MVNARGFWAKVRDGGNDECWEWSAGKCSGYGSVRSKGKHEYAHRIAWALTFGQVPDGLHVLHRCDNPPCCNPAHLFLGTNLDNIKDKVSKRRATAPAGSQSPNAKLTEDDVIDIRTVRAFGASYGALAKAYGVARCTIINIVLRRAWKHVA